MLRVVSTCLQASLPFRLPVEVLREKRNNPATTSRDSETVPRGSISRACLAVSRNVARIKTIPCNFKTYQHEYEAASWREKSAIAL
jgi:hypothetical protein